jgi:hypothetical protein
VRSGVLVVAAAALASACSQPAGVKFEIDTSADPRASEVRLYVGTGGGAAAAITAEGQNHQPERAGTFWPLDDEGSVDVLKLSGSKLSYMFTPVDGVDQVTIIAVGFTDGAPTSKAVLFNVPVRTDVISIWDLVLEPAIEVSPSVAGDAVQVWGATTHAQTCAQAVDPQAEHPIAFIGTDGDQDCDGYQKGTPEECDDEWHKGGTALTTSTLSCVESVPLKDSNTVPFDGCLVGGEYCVDGHPAGRGACSHAKPYCAPSELCTLCDQAGDAQARFDCALNLTAGMPPQAGEVTPTTCRLIFDTSMGVPVLCTQRLVLGRPTWASGLTCTPSAPTYHSASSGSGWASSLVVGGVRMAFEPGPAGDCSVEIATAHEPGMFFEVGELKNEHGLVAVDLANGRGVVGALRFDAMTSMGGCDAASVNSTCFTPINAGSETVAKCLVNAPTVDPSF